MNLAKIRQKARKDRIHANAAEVAAVADIPVAAGDAVWADGNLSAEAVFKLPEAVVTEQETGLCEKAAPTVEEAALPDLPPVAELIEESGLAEPVEDDSAPLRVSTGRVVDPVAAIMAGREAVAADADDIAVEEAQLPAEDADYEEFLSVRVAEEFYGIDIMQIKEIIRNRPVTEIPHAPDFLPGVISLRGVIIPVIDMNKRLGLGSAEQEQEKRIVVVRIGGHYAGLLVDEVIQVARITRSGIEAAPPVLDGAERAFVSGLGRCDSRMLIMLNLESIADMDIVRFDSDNSGQG